MKNSILTLQNIAFEQEDKAKEQFSQSVAAIYRATMQGKPEFVGSCFFISRNSQNYVVTAGHVLDGHEKSSLHVSSKNGLIPIEAKFDILGVVGARGTTGDIWDLAIAPLSKKMLERMGIIHPIPTSSIHPGGKFNSDNLFSVTGCPRSKNKKVDNIKRIAKRRAWTFTASKTSLPRVWEALGAFEDTHICMAFNKKRFVDDEGNRTSPPHPRGMSGGLVGVQHITIEGIADLENQSPFRLVGVFLRYNQASNCLLAVQIGPVLSNFFDGKE